MPKVRGNSQKWATRAAAATQDYTDGVSNPRTRWDDATAAAASTYAQGVQAAITNGSFAKGVKSTGHAGWQQATLAKGPQRFADGVRTGEDAYAAGFAPYQKVIEATQLPARGPKGSAQNYQRATAMAQALRAAKVGGK